MPRGVKKTEEVAPCAVSDAAACCGAAPSSVEQITIEAKRGRRKKFGTIQEVWEGLYETTNKGLRKADLVLTKKNKVMSKARYATLQKSGEYLQNLKKVKE